MKTSMKIIVKIILTVGIFSQFPLIAKSIPQVEFVCHELKAKPLCRQALQAMEDKDYGGALDFVEQAESFEPNNSEIYFFKAKIFSKLINGAGIFSIRGYFVGMRKNLEIVLELSPKNIKAKQLLVELYMMLPGFLGGDDERAQLLADQLDKQDPIEGFIANSSIQIENEQFPAAIKLLQKAVSLAPERLKIKFDLAELLSKTGINSDAVLLYKAICNELKDKSELTETQRRVFSNSLWQISTVALTEKTYTAEAESAMLTYITIEHLSNRSLGRGYLRLADIYLLQGKKDKAKNLLITAKTKVSHKKMANKISKKLKSIPVTIGNTRIYK